MSSDTKISRRDFALGSLLALPLAIQSCAADDKVSLSDAEIAVLKRSMYEVERLVFYLATQKDLPLDAWKRVFDRAVKRVQAGWNVWDENLWKSEDLIERDKGRSGLGSGGVKMADRD